MVNKTDYKDVTVCRNDLCCCRPRDRIWHGVGSNV